MATNTPNYNLKKPDLIDFYDIQDQNDNMDLIDIALKGLEDGKVAKVTGKGLSTEDYTTAEKNKLAGIEAGATADQTASEIKTLYESNANTNAYTDTEKSKLAGIQAGAQVNAVTSVADKTGAVTLAKADVGLGAVENYGIATQADAEAGVSDAKYMTPLKVKQSIDKNSGKTLISSVTLATTAAKVDFNIPAGFREIEVYLTNIKSTTGNYSLQMVINDVTTGNYTSYYNINATAYSQTSSKMYISGADIRSDTNFIGKVNILTSQPFSTTVSGSSHTTFSIGGGMMTYNSGGTTLTKISFSIYTGLLFSAGSKFEVWGIK